ncbi:MAG: DUF1905 domain-containing protein [Phycisphaeraceae bacterium]|nr:MAG: DUF1905 domain-containing protein [Phycisphaeraceae bacterium]
MSSKTANATSKATTRRSAPLAHPSIRFTATLHKPKATAGAKPDRSGWSFLTLPKAASTKLPSRGMVSVRGVLNQAPFEATLQPDGGGGHWLKVERKLREAAGIEIGSTVTVEITPVAPGEEPEPVVPPDLRRALVAAAGPDGATARAAWKSITPAARRDWIQWITSGKRAETRALRIGKACDMLASGKRRPCCFDRSGMYDKSLTCPVADDDVP